MKRPPERCWSAVACLATAAGWRRGSCRMHDPDRGAPGRAGADGERGQAFVDGVRPIEMVDHPQRVRSGRLGPAEEFGQVLRRASGITNGSTAFIREFFLQVGREDESEPGSQRSVSYRRHTVMLRAGIVPRLPLLDNIAKGSGCAPGSFEHGQGAASSADRPILVVRQGDRPDLDGSADPQRRGRRGEMPIRHPT